MPPKANRVTIYPTNLRTGDVVCINEVKRRVNPTGVVSSHSEEARYPVTKVLGLNTKQGTTVVDWLSGTTRRSSPYNLPLMVIRGAEPNMSPVRQHFRPPKSPMSSAR